MLFHKRRIPSIKFFAAIFRIKEKSLGLALVNQVRKEKWGRGPMMNDALIKCPQCTTGILNQEMSRGSA
jgi:hypothetical protein